MNNIFHIRGVSFITTFTEEHLSRNRRIGLIVYNFKPLKSERLYLQNSHWDIDYVRIISWWFLCHYLMLFNKLNYLSSSLSQDPTRTQPLPESQDSPDIHPPQGILSENSIVYTCRSLFCLNPSISIFDAISGSLKLHLIRVCFVLYHIYYSFKKIS